MVWQVLETAAKLIRKEQLYSHTLEGHHMHIQADVCQGRLVIVLSSFVIPNVPKNVVLIIAPWL